MSPDNLVPTPSSLIKRGQKPPVVIIVGPTAVGKTSVAIQLAQRLDGEIVSADSRLFYRGMDIGTAKPSPGERALVPHHMIDIAEPDETWNLSLFQQAARKTIDDILNRNRLPFLVGGTGQYIRAVTHGWIPPAAPPDPVIRAELSEMVANHGAQWLHDQLTALDPRAAGRIDPRNIRRTIRALEVIRLTGERFSTQRRSSTSPFRLLTIGLIRPRHELYAAIDARIDAMFAAGLLAEVERLLATGVSPELPSMTSIGYRECVAVLQGRMTEEKARQQMKRITRVFVRRQANWFKIDDPGIRWFSMTPDPVTAIESTIRDFLLEENDQPPA